MPSRHVAEKDRIVAKKNEGKTPRRKKGKRKPER